jgi:putative FmdB family regulatory protein
MMPYYDFRCNKCKIDWYVQEEMSNAPDTDTCPECSAVCEQHFSAPTLIFKGDCYTNRRKQHNMVYNDKELAKKTQEELVDISKKRAEEQTSPYRNIGLKREWVNKAVSTGQWEKKRS